MVAAAREALFARGGEADLVVPYPEKDHSGQGHRQN
jgi:hypothetical protein